MARYSLFVLKVLLNPKQTNNVMRMLLISQSWTLCRAFEGEDVYVENEGSLTETGSLRHRRCTASALPVVSALCLPPRCRRYAMASPEHLMIISPF